MPPNDPRFLELTEEELLTEWYAWQAIENPNGEEWVDDDFEVELAEFQRQGRASGK